MSDSPTPTRVGVLVGDDEWVRRRLSDLALDPPIHWVDLTVAAGLTSAPAAVVVRLDDDVSLTIAEQTRARWPDVLLVGYLAVPDQDRWVRAQRRGCDLVVNRGALSARLSAALTSSAHVRRYPLVEQSDLAGRLGLVGQVADTPVGAVSVYQIDGRLHAVADACPHAGASLSAGELDGCIVTCPRHGSQFDVRSGERLRGPADTDLATFRVSVAEGQVHLLMDEEV